MRALLVLGAVAAAIPAPAAIVAAPGYHVRTVPTPDVVQGGVVQGRGALFVGQGTPGGGTEYVIRIDANGTIPVITDLNALGGLDLYSNGNLFVTDHGRGFPGAVTGNTVFELERSFTASGPTSALGLEVAPAGSVPSAQDIVLVPETSFVSDGAGPGAGRVLRVGEQGEVEVLISGLDFVRGLAFGNGGRFLVVDFDASSVGSILEYDYFGTSHGVFMSGLSSSAAVAFDRDGFTVLMTGGVAPDGSGTLVAIAPDGGVTERARGLGEIVDLFFSPGRDELWLLETGAHAATAICADGDGDGVCDVDDPCTVSGAVTAPRLVVRRLGPPEGDQRVLFSGRAPLILSPFDPLQSGVRLRLDGAVGPALDAIIPGGTFSRRTHSGWRVKRAGRAWTYQGRLTALGVARVRVELTSDEQALDFTLRSRGTHLALAQTDLPLQAIFGLDPGAREAPCAVATPSCVFARRGRTLRCG
jgi:hypothetical protein